jgi:hypothetical protein
MGKDYRKWVIWIGLKNHHQKPGGRNWEDHGLRPMAFEVQPQDPISTGMVLHASYLGESCRRIMVGSQPRLKQDVMSKTSYLMAHTYLGGRDKRTKA